MLNASRWLDRRRRSAIVALVVVGAVATAGLASGASSQERPRIAFLSFAVANSYDAPMIKAARDVARQRGATMNLFDAANDPKKQLSQLQTVASSGQYDGILLQPIFGPQLIPTVRQAIRRGTKIVNIDQILGSNPATARPPVAGMSGNVVFIQTDIGRKQGLLVRAACRANNLNPCNVGFLYSVKASSLDTAIRKGFDAVIKSVPSIKVVAEGETFYQHAVALKAAQTMLQARSDINLVVGADQGATGAELAARGAGRDVVLVGYGGGALGLRAVRSGRWYGTVMQRPATTGRLGMQCIVAAVRNDRNCGGIDVLTGLPNGGVVTRGNASKFTAEWPG